MPDPTDVTPDPLASPCRRLCTLDESDVCLGCGRTLQEICGWSGLDEAGKRRVIAAAAERREDYRRRFPGMYR